MKDLALMTALIQQMPPTTGFLEEARQSLLRLTFEMGKNDIMVHDANQMLIARIDKLRSLMKPKAGTADELEDAITSVRDAMEMFLAGHRKRFEITAELQSMKDRLSETHDDRR